MRVIDLTHTINKNMPVYPGTDTPKLTPAHIYEGKKTLDEFSIEQFIGKAIVIDCKMLKEGDAITIEYFGDYPCIDDEVMNYILKGNYKGIGFDVIGPDPIADENLTRHKKLFENCDIINIENLTNLEQCGDDLFWFSCFPLKIEKCDGSPIRAVAWFE